MENIKAKIQGILLNCSQKSVIGWAVEESDFEHVAEEIVKNLALSGVSNRRELLIAFMKWQQSQWLAVNAENVDNTVDTYLSNL